MDGDDEDEDDSDDDEDGSKSLPGRFPSTSGSSDDSEKSDMDMEETRPRQTHQAYIEDEEDTMEEVPAGPPTNPNTTIEDVEESLDLHNDNDSRRSQSTNATLQPPAPRPTLHVLPPHLVPVPVARPNRPARLEPTPLQPTETTEEYDRRLRETPVRSAPSLFVQPKKNPDPPRRSLKKQLSGASVPKVDGEPQKAKGIPKHSPTQTSAAFANAVKKDRFAGLSHQATPVTKASTKTPQHNLESGMRYDLRTRTSSPTTHLSPETKSKSKQNNQAGSGSLPGSATAAATTATSSSETIIPKIVIDAPSLIEPGFTPEYPSKSPESLFRSGLGKRTTERNIFSSPQLWLSSETTKNIGLGNSILTKKKTTARDGQNSREEASKSELESEPKSKESTKSDDQPPARTTTTRSSLSAQSQSPKPAQSAQPAQASQPARPSPSVSVVLSQSQALQPPSSPQTKPQSSMPDIVFTCPKCTSWNPITAIKCGVCENTFPYHPATLPRSHARGYMDLDHIDNNNDDLVIQNTSHRPTNRRVDLEMTGGAGPAGSVDDHGNLLPLTAYDIARLRDEEIQAQIREEERIWRTLKADLVCHRYKYGDEGFREWWGIADMTDEERELYRRAIGELNAVEGGWHYGGEKKRAIYLG